MREINKTWGKRESIKILMKQERGKESNRQEMNERNK
jgi:hypothetical protein